MTRAISSISSFLFGENSIRATVDGETPWFVAKDVANALGVEWRGGSTLARIKSAWKGVRKFRTPGGNQELTVINEPAVYKFVFRSNKEEADRFTDWLAGEVLPAIRQSGSYSEDKPVHVREHDRRTSTKIDDALRLKKNIDRLESVVSTIQPQAPSFCAMVVDGEPVFVDVNKFDGAGRAVVIEHDGRLRIENVEADKIGFRPFGKRTALGERYRGPHGNTVRNSVIVVGMVVNQLDGHRQTYVDGVTDRLRVQITTLLEAGPWNDQQIAKQLCCNPKLVREVRREQSRKPPDQLPQRVIEHEPRAAAPYKDRAIALIRQGYSNLAISRMLGCCEETVRRHRVRLAEVMA
ncbi:BRO family protein [Shinella sp.]|uniref:BRO family protein n=1 Tax=Shinella sp. TaxID=1870904 RepID=UPI0028AE3D83|nr:BRO family protein [Shinella sp.]